MKIMSIGGKDYLVRKQFTSDQVRDEAGLSEIKHLYLADTVLKSKNNNIFILASEIVDAEIVEEEIFDENNAESGSI